MDMMMKTDTTPEETTPQPDRTQKAWMTRGEYAVHIGINPNRIGPMVKELKIIELDGQGIDVRVSEVLRAVRTQNRTMLYQILTTNHTTIDEEKMKMDAARTRRHSAEAGLAEMKLKQQAGKLVDAAKLTVKIVERLAIARDRLRAMGRRLAPRVTAMDTREAEAEIINEVDTILNAISVENVAAESLPQPDNEGQPPDS